MQIITTLLSIVYPKYCICCRKIVMDDGLCGTCWNHLVFLSEPACKRCYLQFEYSYTANDICDKCSINKYYLNSIRSAFKYVGIIPRIILRYKNMAEFGLIKFFTNIIVNQFDYTLIDYIIPVPLNKFRLFWRGYNQSELLASAIAKKLNIPIVSNMLIRNRFTKSQGNFDQKGRLTNIINAFTVINCVNIKNKRILLIDDVCTTGATLEECAKALKKAGASEVHACVIAKT